MWVERKDRGEPSSGPAGQPGSRARRGAPTAAEDARDWSSPGARTRGRRRGRRARGVMALPAFPPTPNTLRGPVCKRPSSSRASREVSRAGERGAATGRAGPGRAQAVAPLASQPRRRGPLAADRSRARCVNLSPPRRFQADAGADTEMQQKQPPQRRVTSSVTGQLRTQLRTKLTFLCVWGGGSASPGWKRLDVAKPR